MTSFIPNMTLHDVNELSMLSLAHVGDAVYEIMARTYLCTESSTRVTDLHRRTVAVVNAPAQAQAAARLLPSLTPEEAAVYKRGRNATSHTVPKNQSVSDYRVATGFEALMGWLYLNGNLERIAELTGEDMRGLSKKRPSGEKNPEDI